MSNCDLCHEPHRNRRRTRRGDLLCTSCRSYWEWFESLSPEDKKAEFEMAMNYEGEGL